MKITKVLIANRGEIALRIIRTARSMGYSIVAVYSEQDRDSAHVRESDERVFLPGETLLETYLNIPAIINAAKDTRADAIHPGYGFLSENPLFAQACEREGIVFIGPSSDSIKSMGQKISAREIAVKNNVPVTPGITGSPDELLNNHINIGFPLLVKAAAGGGGKGMRIVYSENELAAAITSTSSEAKNYFGDDTVYIEKFFENPRHIEVQILGDKHGNIIHLFERECSVQRRHQKIIEEAPSPTINAEIRSMMCDAAVKLASSIDYYNAGTIEFLVDKDLNFYFLEMNTRIQVEHPVTEILTGVDIVREQFLIAEGSKLSYKQSDLSISGHAVELRVYAEDPLNNFMPSPGTILQYGYPDSNNLRGIDWESDLNEENKAEPYIAQWKFGVRVDDAGQQNVVQVYSNFDPMISKVIAHGKDRQESIGKLLNFLTNYVVLGIQTNLSFLNLLLQYPEFTANQVHTRYIDNHLAELNSELLKSKDRLDYEVPMTAALIFSLNQRKYINSQDRYRPSNKIDDLSGKGSHTAGSRIFFDTIEHNHAPNEIRYNIWDEIGYWRILNKLDVIINEQLIEIILEENNPDHFTFTINGIKKNAALSYNNQGGYHLRLNENLYTIYMVNTPENTILVKYREHEFIFKRPDMAPSDEFCFAGVIAHKADTGDMVSPMPGRVLTIQVSEGDAVKKGELLMVIEAMKMENNMLAPYDGHIDKIMVKKGDNVDNSSPLIHLVKTSEDLKSE